MKKFLYVAILACLSSASFSQGFFNVAYHGNIFRLSGESGVDIPMGLHIAYKQANNIGFYSSFKMSSGNQALDKYENFTQFNNADKREGEAFDYLLFNAGLNDYVFGNFGGFIGVGVAAITEYKHFKTTQRTLGDGTSYYLPHDRMQRKFNFNIGAFYRIQDIAVVQVDFDTAILGIGVGVGISLPDMFKFSIKEMYDSDEVYKPANEQVLEE